MNSITCTMGIFSCIVLYALTKLFIYAYLIEKVPSVSFASAIPFRSQFVLC